ncbi:MAG: methylenetetrahydrofolate--tRNA-(uracil(54)-C(5))-methyltransferase (FADH(2)-oxidizing) TrmFO [Clostridiales bacterium]|jgi:methylenetetrahydrofolate--tRNA-(uracil-5-)-methyltransferase|nr:methylenetetrahydrofolate--tRNA-(uracil(54)-C(5))-methyltransferase (FADH(2)-oxidizing) TrmFO [Clostridiales bacterium]
MTETVDVIGGGLAGCEAALQISRRGIAVNLFECKPGIKSPAHVSDSLCELVCSNSLKSNDVTSACGLLKEELRALKSAVIECADACAIPSGGALAVDREKFSAAVTNAIESYKNITVRRGLVTDFDPGKITVIATGPLTVGLLNDKIAELTGGLLHFYDAAAPIVSAESIDTDFAFAADRYGKGGGEGDYLNCPLSEDEYVRFVEELTAAERVILRDFEGADVFEGCMPVEVMAARGRDTLRFGPLKPVGLTDPKTGKRPYAVVQLRKENAEGTMYNLVGFQTNLKFGEQRRVFSMIPALKNAEFLRFGVMHRNSFIDAPKALNADFSLKKFPNVFIAGQLSGVEGYAESIAAGLAAGINAARRTKGGQAVVFPPQSMLGALSRYLAAPNPNFQPMSANFGLLPPLDANIRDKREKKRLYGVRALQFVCIEAQNIV